MGKRNKLCLRSPCDARCPNAPEPPAVHICKDCGENIVPGDECAEIDGSYYHIECLENMTTRELLALFDVFPETAEMEEEGW